MIRAMTGRMWRSCGSWRALRGPAAEKGYSMLTPAIEKDDGEEGEEGEFAGFAGEEE